MNQEMEDIGPRCFGTATRTSFVDMGDKTIPGPGTYAPWRWDKIENPEWVTGTSQERDSFLEPHKQQYPSPQQYEVNFASAEKSSKKFSFPESNKQSKTLETFHPLYNPDIKSSVHEDPHFSFGYHFETNYDNKKPGVGSYQLKNQPSSFNKTQNIFGTGDRPMPYGEQGKFPGATKYNNTIDFNRTAKYSFAKTERVINPKSRGPPAKFYDIGTKNSAPKNNRFNEHRSREKQSPAFQTNDNPGPNHYSSYVANNVPNGIMYNSKRGSLENTAIEHFPSPQKYAGNEILEKYQKGQSFIKDGRHLSVKAKKIPGPGTYEFSNRFSHLGGFIAVNGKKQKPEEPSVQPAANHYRPKVNITKLRAQSTVVFRGDRADFSKTITGEIGPGQYDLRKDSKGEYGKIGKSRRPELNSSTLNPGVGDYDIPNTIGKLPKYYKSPKKLNENGYSTFHEKLKMKILQRQRNKILESEKSEKQEKEEKEGQSQVDVRGSNESPVADD